MKLKDGYSGVKAQTVRKWIKESGLPKKQSGPPSQSEFENDLINALTAVKSVEKKDADGAVTKKMVVIANAAFSYKNIFIAADKLKKDAKWIGDEDVQKLTFSHGWIHSFIERKNLRRRRISAMLKKRPTNSQIQARMAAIQKRFVDGGFKTVVNFDETATTFAANPNFCYVFEGEESSRLRTCFQHQAPLHYRLRKR